MTELSPTARYDDLVSGRAPSTDVVGGAVGGRLLWMPAETALQVVQPRAAPPICC